jgi:hypothetical protein
MPNFQPSSTVNFTGNLSGTGASTVVSNAGSAFSGTVNYRNGVAPSGSIAFGTISPSYTTDGNVVVNVPYTYSPGGLPADFILVYYKEGGGATVSPDNPAVSTNPSSGNLNFTLKPSTSYRFGTQLVRRTESGLTGTSITASGADTVLTAGNYTGTVYGTSAETLAQTPVFESYGPATFDFSNTVHGFTTTNATISATANSLIISPSATDPQIRKSGLSFSGATYQKIRARVRRTSGSAAWEGTVYYTTSAGPSVHGESGTYFKQITGPSSPAAWNIMEWDMSTSSSPNDWLNSTVSGLRFDFSQSPDSNWEVDWISVGRVGIPTYGADYGSDTSNITGLSGDGENRILARFSGGFNTQEYDPSNGTNKYVLFPVTKDTGIKFSAILSSNGTAGPSTGFYGTKAIKVYADSTGTKTVYFSSSSTTYNMPLDANSKWILSSKMWCSSPAPTPFPLPITMGVRTAVSPTTGYSVTNNITSAVTWQSLSGTLDLSGDSSTSGLLFTTIGNTNGSPAVYFDGIMLEKRVGPGTTPSAWVKSAITGISGSSGNSAIAPSTIGTGSLLPGFTMNQGDGTLRPILNGLYLGYARDADVISFSPAYVSVPTVIWLPGAKVTATGIPGNASATYETTGLTTTGFTAKLKLTGLAGTTSPITETFGSGGAVNTIISPAAGGANISADYVINKGNTASEAWDDKYTYKYTVSVTNTPDTEPGTYIPGKISIAGYARIASGWTQVFTNIITGGTTSASTSKTIETTFTLDGVIQSPAVGQYEFAVDKVFNSEDVGGGLTGFTSVTYSIAAAPTQISATEAASYSVPFLVVANGTGV